MEKSIYKYILRHTKKEQVLLVLLAFASFPVLYFSLEIPKLIVNDAIGRGPNALHNVFGFSLDAISYLLLVCLAFLAMMTISGGLKYVNNVFRGVVGERMLRRFRYTLYCRILRFPLPHFKNVSSSEIIPMVTAETEPLGGFIGDSIALPIYQGGTLITYVLFIFLEDFWLGLASITLYPMQIYLIPKLQYKVNQLSKQRVQAVRKLADHIGESANGITDIHANDTGHFERATASQQLGRIFTIRYEIYRRKFFIKFLTNFLAQLTPFFFFLIGGYFALKGELTVGALVAVLAAYKEIPPPWKELLKFYQITEDVKVKYAQIIEQFAPDGMFAEKLLEAEARADSAPAKLQGDVRVTRVQYAETADAQPAQFDFVLKSDQHTAILSKDGSGVDELTQLLARLLMPSSGALQVGKIDLSGLSEAVTGQRIGYCAATSRVFNASIRDNLYYGLKHQPQQSRQAQPEEGEEGEEGEGVSANKSVDARVLREAVASGNSVLDADADWVDIRLAGAKDGAEFKKIVLAVIECVELDDELLTLALRSAELEIPPRLAEQIVTLRAQLMKHINEIESGDIIEPLQADRYIQNLTVAENLVFGAPAGGQSAGDFLVGNPLGQRMLGDSGLQQELSEIGLELAGLMVELFSDVPDDSELFEQFSFIRAEQLPEYQQIVTLANAEGDKDEKGDGEGEGGKGGKGGTALQALSEAQRAMLVAVSLQLCPARHRLDLLTDKIQEKVVAARSALMKEVAKSSASEPRIQFFDQKQYNHSISVQENLLFGKIIYAKGHLQPRVTETIKSTLKSTNLNQEILLAGLNCAAGAGGGKLSSIVRQKLTLARTLLKDPDILILHNILSGLDAKSVARIAERIFELRAGRNLIWALNEPKLLPRFDHLLLLENHKLTHSDSPKALAQEIEGL